MSTPTTPPPAAQVPQDVCEALAAVRAAESYANQQVFKQAASRARTLRAVLREKHGSHVSVIDVRDAQEEVHLARQCESSAHASAVASRNAARDAACALQRARERATRD